MTRIASWEDSPEAFLERRESLEIIHDAIARLPPLYREVLVLRDLEELTNDEVASLVGSTPNAVKVRLHRARQALRGMLDPHVRGGRHE